MDKTPWYRWPENRLTGMEPWFVILRRLVFVPFFVVGVFFTYAAILCAYGKDDARDFVNRL